MSSATLSVRAHRLNVLRDLVEIPTAPFHEDGVARYVTEYVSSIGLECERDPYGNLLVEYRGSGVSTAFGPPLALVAHMDHPALEIEAVNGRSARARLLGGVRPACFDKPVEVLLQTGSGPVAARITGCEVVRPREVYLNLDLDAAAVPGDWGVFDLPAYIEEGPVLYTRAADDLVGCAAILLTLERLAELRSPVHLICVFTRAEEVGLVGAALLAESGRLAKETIVVSLEASRELPGAVMGEGPVIRVGDVARTFDAEAEAVLLAGRRVLLAADPELGIQRQLMSGGTCEATAFGLRGYRVTGVAVPLGNYHNVGPEDTVSPEYISIADFLTEVDLLVASAQALTEPRPDIWENLTRELAQYRGRLERTNPR